MTTEQEKWEPYLIPQVGFIEDHFGFLLTTYWQQNDTAKYIGINFMFINLNITIAFGVRRVRNE